MSLPAARGPSSPATRRHVLIAATFFTAIALGWLLAAGQPGPALLRSASAATTSASAAAPRVGGNAAGLPWWVTRYRAAIPQATYSAIVISPRPDRGVELGDTVQFVIRAEDARGNVEDFAFHVPAGETLTIPLAGDGGAGWSPRGEAILYAPDNGVFAAWGITSNGLVRFEPVERDAEAAAEERERQRDLEQFRRERMRTE